MYIKIDFDVDSKILNLISEFEHKFKDIEIFISPVENYIDVLLTPVNGMLTTKCENEYFDLVVKLKEINLNILGNKTNKNSNEFINTSFKKYIINL